MEKSSSFYFLTYPWSFPTWFTCFTYLLPTLLPLPLIFKVNHWLVGNIKGSDVSTGDVIAEYRGSGPPKGTGMHRYIFLVFEQKEKLTFDEPRSIKTSKAHRLNFSIRKFAKKYNLGKAFAGNFYIAQWDQYVEERNKQNTDWVEMSAIYTYIFDIICLIFIGSIYEATNNNVFFKWYKIH